MTRAVAISSLAISGLDWIETEGYDITATAKNPVIDKTGIDGRFWFQLEWVEEPGQTSREASPSLLAAMEEQLGLTWLDGLRSPSLTLGAVSVIRCTVQGDS